jgi:DNA-3-methyladenine glycosylase II
MHGDLKERPLTKRQLELATLYLANEHAELTRSFELFGAPPLWDRPPGFATLLQIILEQQVSLASAKACFEKLAALTGDVTPENLLSLRDADLRSVGFSRQKAAYARHLSEAVLEWRIDLDGLHRLPDAEAKAALMKLKGVGEWTSDIYLLMALLRPDVMPKGDIALHAAWQSLSGDPKPSADEFLRIAQRWRPFRSVAARMLWHFYLCQKNSKAPSGSTV